MKGEFNLEALSPGGRSSASQDSKLLYIFTGPQICSVQCYPSEPSISRPELLHCKQHVLWTAFTSSTSGAATPQEQQYLLPHSDQIPQAASLQAKPNYYLLLSAAAAARKGAEWPALTAEAEVTGKQSSYRLCVTEQLRLAFKECKLASRRMCFMDEFQ